MRWIGVGLAAAVVALIIVLAAGSGAGDPDADRDANAAAPNVVQVGAPGEASHKLSEAELDDIRPPKHTDADVEFVQGMVHHHAQALAMTAFVPDRAVGKDVPLLAEKIEVTQTSEIELLERWLTARDEEVPGAESHAHDHGGELMPGMLTEAQMDRLEAATGKRFNRRFLESMIRHHQGAITMVAELRRAGGGMEPEADKLAREIEADQTIEISRMRALLARH